MSIKNVFATMYWDNHSSIVEFIANNLYMVDPWSKVNWK